MDHQNATHSSITFMDRFSSSKSNEDDEQRILPLPPNVPADDPFPEILGLIDPNSFFMLQFSLELRAGVSINFNLQAANPVVGQGASFVVRRVGFESSRHQVGLGPAGKPKFVVVKRPILENWGDKDIDRVRTVLLELRILLHRPISEHPNIVQLVQFRWDTQSGDNLVSPSLVLEFADLGSLATFQDPKRLSLCSSIKKSICLDIARGLQVLHSHGVVHGDVKSENVLLFVREDGGYRAKISDFGSSLIGVVDDPNAQLQKLRAFSRVWRAPEYDQPLKPAILVQTDIYSYGLTVWRIMLNGVHPYQLLYRDAENQVRALLSTATQIPPYGSVISLTPEDFDAIKSKGNLVVGLALESMKESHDRDDVVDMMKNVLAHSLQMELIHRSRTVDDLINMLCDCKANAIPTTEPNILKKGNFDLFSPNFPKYIYGMRSMPPDFRRVITNALTKASDHLFETDIGRRASLALAICHIECFCVDHSLRQAAEWATKAAQRGDVIAQGLIARIYNAAEISIPQDLPWKSWLVNAVKHGSFAAKRTLQETDKELHDETMRADLKNRQERTLTHRRIFEAYVTQCSAVSPHQFIVNDGALPLPPKLLEVEILSLPGTSLLHCASYLGDVEDCGFFLKTSAFTINMTNGKGETALHYACRNNMENAIQFLLTNGANPNVQSFSGVTPLHHTTMCAVFGPNLIGLLVDCGADVNALSSVGYADVNGLSAVDYGYSVPGSPLHWAVGMGDVSVVKTLLEYGADPNLNNVHQASPLQIAIQHREFEILDLLLQSSDKDKFSPDDLLPRIGWKYTFPRTRIIHIYKRLEPSLLVIGRLKRYEVAIDERKILFQALDDDDIALADHFIRQLGLGPDADLGTVFHEGADRPVRLDYLLHIAVFKGSLAMVKTIIQHLGGKIPPDLVVDGNSILGTLSMCTNPADKDVQDIAVRLLSAGADVNTQDASSKTPLYHAVQWSRVSLVQILLDTRYTPLPNDLHEPLWRCLRRSSSKVIISILDLFLKAKPDLLLFPHDLTTSESNIIHIICSDPESVRDDAINKQVLQAVVSHMSTLPGGLERLQACLEHKAPPFNYTALHLAVMWGNLDAAQLLLSLGADINASGDILMSQTPLDVAEGRRNMKKDGLSNTAVGLDAERIAYERRTEAIVKLLKEKGGRNGFLDFSTTMTMSALTDLSLDSLVPGLQL